MVKKRSFVVGFFSAIFLMSCAGMTVKYYGMAGVIYEHGKLLGPKDKDDLPFSKCAPTATSKNPCVVMFATDFHKLKQDYQDTKMRLIECEKSN
jgi:hypothetical protein